MAGTGQEMSVAQVRARLADVLNAAYARGVITYVTSRGRRVAVIAPLGAVPFVPLAPPHCHDHDQEKAEEDE